MLDLATRQVRAGLPSFLEPIDQIADRTVLITPKKCEFLAHRGTTEHTKSCRRSPEIMPLDGLATIEASPFKNSTRVG